MTDEPRVLVGEVIEPDEVGAGGSETTGRPRARSVGPEDGDPFPTDAFVTLVKRLPRYARLAWGLAGEPTLSRKRRAAVVAAAAYLVSPVDLVPGVIPVVGQADDIAIALLALRTALRALDEPTRLRQLEAAGLAPTDLDDDTRTLGLVALWLGRRGVRVGRRLLALGVAAGAKAARTGGRLAVSAGEAGARSGVRLGRRAAGAAGRTARAGAIAGGGRLRSAAGRIRRRGGDDEPATPEAAPDIAPDVAPDEEAGPA